jgi:hypothetical protein
LLFWGVKISKFFDEDPGSEIRDPGWRQFGSGIRDGKKSDPGSGINIPDPQHCLQVKRQFESDHKTSPLKKTKKYKILRAHNNAAHIGMEV